MLFLALAVACSLAIAVVFKVAELRDLDRTALLTVNYLAAALLAVVLQGVEPAGPLTSGLVALGVGQGVLFIAGFWLFSLAIREAGIGLAAGVMRLSVVVPFLASWAIWSEAPTLWQVVGLVIAGVAFFLVAQPSAEPPGKLGPPDPGSSPGQALKDENTGPAGRPRRIVGLLALLFLTGGAVDINMKVFQEEFAGSGVPISTFLLFVFGVAFLVGAIAVGVTGLRTGRWPSAQAWVWGIGLGLVNYGSAEFLLRALEEIEGTVAFPANSVAIVLGAALLGRVVWKEPLSRANLAGLGLAAAALVLLAG
ncbi:EamA family transporter [Rubrivirga sp.]|uniref:EamA family transporter n=1 Tax=Rubrivirga sp. TaxID=1885344 RepID=UPI003C74FD5E